jgi:sodium-independent sulfate anion transporter 11
MRTSFGWEKFQSGFQADQNIRRTTAGLDYAARELPSAAGRYILDLVPVVQWLPKYSPRWLVSDLIAGLTVGLILVPQALAYAKIAGVPLQHGLLASWLPPAIYFIMGTSKGMLMGSHMFDKLLILI